MRTACWLLLGIMLSAIRIAMGDDSALQTELKDPALAANWIYDDLPKAMADAKAGISRDANGNIVRARLDEPPIAYREPDPEAPVDPKDDPATKKKKFHWPWQH